MPCRINKISMHRFTVPMLESKIQKKIIDYLKSKGAYVVKTIRTNRNGTPDLLCCYRGRFIAVECKRPGKELDALQKYHREQIRKAGGVSIKADDLHAIDQLLPRI